MSSIFVRAVTSRSVPSGTSAIFTWPAIFPTTPSRVIALAGRQRLRRRGQAAYSNLGAALLGQILAGRAGCSFPDLLRARIFTPLGMSSAAVATRQQKAAPGWSATGLPRAPWVQDGYAPAGGVIATIEDMARLLTAILDRTAPGYGSLTPVPDVETTRPNRRSGMFWMIDSLPSGNVMIWHNDATGGILRLPRDLPGDPAGGRRPGQRLATWRSATHRTGASAVAGQAPAR